MAKKSPDELFTSSSSGYLGNIEDLLNVVKENKGGISRITFLIDTETADLFHLITVKQKTSRTNVLKEYVKAYVDQNKDVFK
jgi:hypothetical protein